MAQPGIWAIRSGSFCIPVAHAAGQNVVTVLGLRFLTDNTGLAAGTAGLIFALVKIYDGFLDPAVGAWSDNARTRWGRRLPFLALGGVAMPLGLAMLVESSSDPQERTRLMAWRTYGTAVGTLLGSTMPAWLLVRFGAGRDGHMIVALVVGAVVLATTLLALRLMAHAPRTVPPEGSAHGYNLVRQARLAWANRPFRILATAHIFLLFGASIGSAAMAYFSRYVLEAGDGALGNYFMASTAAMVLSMPVWVRLSARAGKKACYIAAMAGFGLAHLSWLLAGAGEPVAGVLVRAVFSGFSGGGMILCAYALLSDAVRYDYVQSGQRREGAFAGFTTLFDKLSAAAAVAAMGGFLSAMGYVSSSGAAAVVQSDSAVLAVMLCVAVVPALAMGAAILVMLRYDLDPADVVAAEAALEGK
ncbi:MFS transporter [Novosphingobium sp.]|uniref:MFS transporter n=1 Tax=Novosphingobium sp. TaxID=1874826 RepID=UPI0035662CE7